MGYTYLLHLHQYIAPGRHTCRHYLGSADDLDARLRKHATNPDARLLQVAKDRGIGFDVVRVWQAEDARFLERQLKQRKAGPMLCPICRSERKRAQWQLPLFTGQAWALPDFSLNDVVEIAF